MKRKAAISLYLILMPLISLACTSMIVSADRSATGRPLLWKHRDTGAPGNFVERVAPRDGNFGFVALFNDGDSLLLEAWMGMNDAGFAIMNTASYNLAPDTASIKDREGLVMAEALRRCSSVSDFEALLQRLPKPLGVQANFGVIDAHGNGAYFETDDYSYTRYDLADAPGGVLVRTNYSFSGNDTDGSGYIRYDNACHLIGDGPISPATLTEELSRSYYHSMLGRDVLNDDTCRFAIDQDFIPRRISTASIVIEGVTAGGDPANMIMWTMLGYPPVAHVTPVTLGNVPEGVRPTLPGWRSAESEQAAGRKRLAFPVTRGSGPHYIDLDYLRQVIPEQHALSLKAYSAKSAQNY